MKKQKNGLYFRTTETAIQQNCVRWFYLQYPKLEKLLFAIPNGGFRNGKEAAKLKREGVQEGVADLFLSIQRFDFGGYYIEMKNGTSRWRHEEEQKRFQEQVESQGYKYTLCLSFEEFQDKVTAYLNEKPTKETYKHDE